MPRQADPEGPEVTDSDGQGRLIAVAALFGALAAAATGPTLMNHDAAWYLHMAATWMDGAALYRDIIDTNPPLIVFLTAVPALAARSLDLPAPALFKAFAFALASASALMAFPLLRRLARAGESRFMLAAVTAFLLLPFVKTDFGQREHFAVMFVLPYVLALAARAGGRGVSPRAELALGALGGLGVAFKPHFVPAWIAIELCAVLLLPVPRKWVRPGAVGAAATLLLYALVVLLFVPQYVEVAGNVLQVYGGLNASAAVLLRLPDLQLWIVAALVCAVVRLPPGEWRASAVLFAAATAFLFAAMIQLKGWGYHLYPFRVIAILYGALVLSLAAEAHAGLLDAVRGGRRTLVAAVLAATVTWTGRYVAEAWRPIGVDQAERLLAVVSRERAESLATLSMRTIIYPSFPVVNYANARWVLRHNSLWFMPGLYEAEMREGTGDVPFRSLAAMGALERQYFEQIVADLCAAPPRILIVEPPIPAAPPGRRSLDLARYYAQDARVERLFAAYEPLDTIGSFRVHIRRGGASCEGNQSRARD